MDISALAKNTAVATNFPRSLAANLKEALETPTFV